METTKKVLLIDAHLTYSNWTEGKLNSAFIQIAKDFFTDNPSQLLFQGKGVDNLFLHITSNYKFCGVEIMPGYNCFDIFRSPQIEKDLENYPKHLGKVFNLQTKVTA